MCPDPFILTLNDLQNIRDRTVCSLRNKKLIPILKHISQKCNQRKITVRKEKCRLRLKKSRYFPLKNLIVIHRFFGVERQLKDLRRRSDSQVIGRTE